eukprot:365707-Chlamydomonas_euryale.AAC.41
MSTQDVGAWQAQQGMPSRQACRGFSRGRAVGSHSIILGSNQRASISGRTCSDLFVSAAFSSAGCGHARWLNPAIVLEGTRVQPVSSAEVPVRSEREDTRPALAQHEYILLKAHVTTWQKIKNLLPACVSKNALLGSMHKYTRTLFACVVQRHRAKAPKDSKRASKPAKHKSTRQKCKAESTDGGILQVVGPAPQSTAARKQTSSKSDASEASGVHFSRDALSGRRAYSFCFAWANNKRVVTCEEVLKLWQENDAFRTQFTAALTNVGYDAFYWETPAVSKGTLCQPFSMVVLDASGAFNDKGDPQAFAAYILGSHDEDEVAAFPNLGKDGTMLAPCPPTDQSGKPVTDGYGHLASFLRNGRKRQHHNLWRLLGKEMEMRLRADPSPVWMSTAGNAVPWLHVRIDSRPKYIKYEKYRQKPHTTPRPAAPGQEWNSCRDSAIEFTTTAVYGCPKRTVTDGLRAEVWHAAAQPATVAAAAARGIKQAALELTASQPAKAPSRAACSTDEASGMRGAIFVAPCVASVPDGPHATALHVAEQSAVLNASPKGSAELVTPLLSAALPGSTGSSKGSAELVTPLRSAALPGSTGSSKGSAELVTPLLSAALPGSTGSSKGSAELVTPLRSAALPGSTSSKTSSATESTWSKKCLIGLRWLCCC